MSLSEWKRKRLRKKIEKTRDKYDDKQYLLHKWGFGLKPSEQRKAEDGIKKLRLKLERLEREYYG